MSPVYLDSGGADRPPHGGGGGGGGTSPPPASGPKGATSSLITSTGGLFGQDFKLVFPFFNMITNQNFLALYDVTSFDCEEDCIHNFRMESAKIGRVVDVHKVYLEYRDFGKVTFNITVNAYLLNRSTGKETYPKVTKEVIINGKKDLGLHSKFVDLKIQGERPQLQIFRAANKGPLSLTSVILIGTVMEEAQL